MERVLITSISGQDSIELSKYILENYPETQVFTLGRRNARALPRAVIELKEKYPIRYNMISGDITDMSSIVHAINICNPEGFFNLAAQSHVGLSFKEPISTSQITGFGVLNCLEAIRLTNPEIRFYQAGSSEQFGNVILNGETELINELTPFRPVSPYACAKVFGHNITKNYRESYGLHASVGILFNHEGIYRKPDFVTRKVTIGVNKVLKDKNYKLKLGTQYFARDWGAASDYVRAMWLMLQQDIADDYVIATGHKHTGEELLEIAFGRYNLNWKDHVLFDKEFERPLDLKILLGDASKARQVLGWEPKTSFKEMIYKMLDNDALLLAKYGDILE